LKREINQPGIDIGLTAQSQQLSAFFFQFCGS
jgi:hypothetical protein